MKIDAVAGFADLEGPGALRIRPRSVLDDVGFKVDDQMMSKTRHRQIGEALFASVYVGGAWRKDFCDEAGFADFVGMGQGLASDHYVGVVVAFVVDAKPGTLHCRSAAGTFGSEV